MSYLDQRFGGNLDGLRWDIQALLAHSRQVSKEMEEWGADVLYVQPSIGFRQSPLGVFWQRASVMYLHEPYRQLYEAWPENVWAAAWDENEKVTLKKRVGRTLRDSRITRARRLQVRTEIEWSLAYDRILVNSLYSRESVLRAYGQDSMVCPLGVDHAEFASTDNSQKKHMVVSLGELNEHKGGLLAIEAVGQIPQNRRPTLRWFGNRVDPHYAAECTARASSLDVDFSCQLMVDDKYLAEQLSTAACMIYTAQLEPLGLAPLEANLAGTAVVAVAEGGVRETIVNGINGTLINGRDAKALGEALSVYTDDLHQAVIAGNAARAHVQERYGWKAAGIALEEHLLSAIASRSTRKPAAANQ